MQFSRAGAANQIARASAYNCKLKRIDSRRRWKKKDTDLQIEWRIEVWQIYFKDPLTNRKGQEIHVCERISAKVPTHCESPGSHVYLAVVT